MYSKLKPIIALGVVATTALALAGCAPSASSDKTVITIAGPNQWNTDAQSFGPAWEDLVARFEAAEPNIEVKTVVLPLTEFYQTLSTQLAAGTAPELIFNQASHKPDQVVTLDDYFDKPNPYIEGNEKWITAFNPDYIGGAANAGRNAAQHYEFVPFNLYLSGIYYNKDVFTAAGIHEPPATYGDLIKDCKAISAAGYTPLAFDNSYLAQASVVKPITSMLLTKYFDELNYYGPDGKPGTSKQISVKDFAKGVLTGEFTPQNTPEIGEAFTLAKQVVDACATPNWSGVASTGAAFTGAQEFLAGKAAMSFGANFSANSLNEVDWKYGTLPFPTITKQDSPLSTGEAARSGANTGGTSYMIPATTKGDKLDAAVKFLQFASSPVGIQPWLDQTGGIPALADAKPAPGLEGLTTGDWALNPTVPQPALLPKAVLGQAIYTGYLTGNKSLDDQLTETLSQWTTSAKEVAADGKWTDDWAQQ
ncbi:ABC transporter substrate-binding protein [Herbiconiux ginsengi]|uniref:Multiple sugar transport system substrate-binding protein n=1 Tax=Herbiconiux ginsengi TaxID=381665 RepID=A0A1H3K7D3_9MICO|nr:extracellular solute-binding protein [Herbiconiux ginsengi]SDY47394.1 multiple sugar transport system substrate-binding protein [Herbiconiux ginsengi]